MFRQSGGQHDNVLKQAFYNTASVLFVFFSGMIAVSVYYVLEPFIRPLVWAALYGTFLHPIKRKATNAVQNWLLKLEEDGKPFSLGCFSLPFEMINKISDILGDIIRSNYKLLLAVFAMLPLTYYLVVFCPLDQIFLGV